jgi:ABC-type transport system substrate-binding protein
MIWIRRLIIFVPVALLAFFAVALVSVRWARPRKINQLTIGSIGEAQNLNPILATTTADGEIHGLIFEGLVKYDEHIELAPNLAERWEITQQSTLFFETAAQAQEALGALQKNRARWKQWSLRDVVRDEARLRLTFEGAGTAYEETLLPLFNANQPQPVSFVRVNLKSGAKLQGAPVTSESVLRRLEAAPDSAPMRRRVHSHFVNSSGEFDLVVIGDPQPIVERLVGLLKAGAPNDAVGHVKVAETFAVLNEPEILFWIRRGVRWHDGKPFTARDVEFTYKALVDEQIASPRRSSYELVRAVVVEDDHRVRVIYRKPFSPALSSWTMGMLPRHILEGKDSKWWAANFNRSPVGTGPYRFDEWKSGQYVRLRRNEDYWQGKPHLDFVTVRVIPDPVSLRLLFETGELDFWGVEAHANKKFLNHPRYEVFSRLATGYHYIGWNLKRPLFQDVRVRRALAHAVNVPQMVQYIVHGQGEQSTGPFPPQMGYASQDIQLYEYDPDKARALLAAAGWKPGEDGILRNNGKRFEFTLITNHANEIRKDIATLVQNDLRRIGIEVQVQLYEWAVFTSQYIRKQDFDACVLGWALGYSPDQYQLWHSSQAEPGKLNHCSYQNPEVDRLLELVRSEYDPQRVKQLTRKLHRILYEDQPYLFLYVPRDTAAMRRGEFRVRRPDDSGNWLDEPVRSTPLGFRVYQTWWQRQEMTP